MADIIATCEHCAYRFEVRRTAAGSLQNCPSCGKATKIAGSFDPSWEAAQALAVVLCLAAGALVGLAAGPVWGGVAAVSLLGLAALLKWVL